MAMGPEAWRNAASVMLFAKAPSSTRTSFDYRLLMLRRSSKSQFMPNHYVFPGGVSSESDFHPDWLDAFRRFESNRSPDEIVSRRPAQRPLLMRPQAEDAGLLDRSLAFRLCAIRETFEESGIFVPSSGRPLPPVELAKWRPRVHNDPSEFLRMCHELEACPDVWSMNEWSCWLTPLGRSDSLSRRFDTLFYTCFLDESAAGYEASLDEHEISDVRWTDPDEMLTEAGEGKLTLAPPQVYELTRMKKLGASLADLARFVESRKEKGVETWLPVFIKCRDGILSALPGDELYPDEPDYDGSRTPEMRTSEHTIEKMNKLHPKMHRSAMYGKNKVVPFVSDRIQLEQLS